MCGIIGYVGNKPCLDTLLAGLTRLEYRGYDSAGVAVIDEHGQMRVRRRTGRLASLRRSLRVEPVNGTCGIGHTRWATHGRPSERNAHPHRAGDVAIVHNGIIENACERRAELIERGRTFVSETDSEVIAHLIDEQFQRHGDLQRATRAAIGELDGSFALVVMSARAPSQVIVARRSSPIVIGIGDGEKFVASDATAMIEHTRECIFLEDGDVATVAPGFVEIRDEQGELTRRPVEHLDWDVTVAEKNGFKHFMLKEIYEQPECFRQTIGGHVHREEGGVHFDSNALGGVDCGAIDRVVFVACGTSYYASSVMAQWLEKHARVPAMARLASEFRYDAPVVDERTLCIAVSQSGETADTLAAMDEAKRLGAATLAICNVRGSSIARGADAVVYTHAGPEIGVASTKAFTTQLAVGGLLTIWMGRHRQTIDPRKGAELIEALASIPAAIESVLSDQEVYRPLARQMAAAQSCLFLGRGSMHHIAHEGALKLKEISYIHAEGYAAGEMKHGPIALIEEEFPVICLAMDNHVLGKVMSNLQEVRARGGRIFAVTTAENRAMDEVADVRIDVPEVHAFAQPVVAVVALQLLAYHVADHLGTDVDQPRNLAKSVTVE
jgi:glucosamine--fructose-6-phosphate aminotransferase (isomerizing)